MMGQDDQILVVTGGSVVVWTSFSSLANQNGGDEKDCWGVVLLGKERKKADRFNESN